MSKNTYVDRTKILEPGQAITRWLYGEAHDVPFVGKPRPIPDYVDYAFGLAGARSAQSPARERLEARTPPSDLSCPKGPFKNLYVGSLSPNVDFSIFAYTPRMLTRNLQCLLVPQTAGRARFRIATCGQIRVWLGDELVAHFDPFILNSESATELELDLPAHPVALTVELQDIHERNTENFFSVSWLDGVSVSASIDHPEAETLAAVGDVIDTMEAAQVLLLSGGLRLRSEVPAPVDLNIEVTGIRNIPRGDYVHTHEQAPVIVALPAGENEVELPQEKHVPHGCVIVTFQTEYAGIRIERKIGTTIYSDGIELTGKTVAERKAQLLEIAKTDPGQEGTVALVQLAMNQPNEDTPKIIDAALTGIEERRDCSDFTMLPILRIWRDHRDQLDDATQARMRKAILGYRYWMSEPGNDGMWFWSENHVLCFHVSQLVAGHMFSDQVFENSGELGAAKTQEANDRLHRWFDGMDRDGLCEWNSSAYYPIDLQALFSLHDMSPDDGLRKRAAALIDRIFIMTALHMTGGSPAGAQGRSYEKELLCGAMNELGPVGSIAFGGKWFPTYGRAAFCFCLSDYEPPEEAARLAFPASGEVIKARYFQGAEKIGKLTLWKNQHVQLSTVSDHKTGELGQQQHLLDAQFAGHPFARIWINHPGDRKPWSERRPSKLAGNHWLPRIAQHERCAMAIYDIPDDESFVPFSQIFGVSGAFKSVEAVGSNTLLYRSEGATAVVWCSASLETETEGPYRGTVYRANALRAGWLVRLEYTENDAEYEQLKSEVPNWTFSFDAVALMLRHDRYALSYDGQFSLDNDPLIFDWPGPKPHFTVEK